MPTANPGNFFRAAYGCALDRLPCDNPKLGKFPAAAARRRYKAKLNPPIANAIRDRTNLDRFAGTGTSGHNAAVAAYFSDHRIKAPQRGDWTRALPDDVPAAVTLVIRTLREDEESTAEKKYPANS